MLITKIHDEFNPIHYRFYIQDPLKAQQVLKEQPPRVSSMPLQRINNEEKKETIKRSHYSIKRKSKDL